MNLHTYVVQNKKLLTNLDGWLQKGVECAAAKKFEPGVLLQMRLAPDMFPLVRQVQAACDNAKFAAARTADKTPPSHPDTETTVDELRKRIADVVGYLDTFTPADFEGANDRKVSLPRWEGKFLTAEEYYVQHAQPNFFFHLTTAYAILRHCGVDVGKRDYLGPIDLRS